MPTKNIQDVYLDIVAAFGATPLDEQEVKNILTKLVKEVEAEAHQAGYEKGHADALRTIPVYESDNIKALQDNK